MNSLALDRPLVFFDIESTGVSPRADRIIELAAIRLDPDGSETSKTWLLNPGVPIPPDTVEIHHITDEIVAGCPSFADVAGEIMRFFDGADLAGYNSDRFDIPMLEEEFMRCGMSFGAQSRRSVDVQKIFFKREPRDLSAAVRFYCGRSHDGAHGAEADARATLDVFRGQLEKYPDLPRTVAALDDALSPRDPLNIDRLGTLRWIRGELCVNFGRRKSEPLRDIARRDRNYLKWIVNGDFPVEVRSVCKRLLEDGILPDPPPEALAEAAASSVRPAQTPDQAGGSRRHSEGRAQRPAPFNTSLADAFGGVFGKASR